MKTLQIYIVWESGKENHIADVSEDFVGDSKAIKEAQKIIAKHRRFVNPEQLKCYKVYRRSDWCIYMEGNK